MSTIKMPSAPTRENASSAISAAAPGSDTAGRASQPNSWQNDRNAWLKVVVLRRVQVRMTASFLSWDQRDAICPANHDFP